MDPDDDFEEPCALDYRDAPEYFHSHPQRQPPADLKWWAGWWPAGGINSVDDLKCWVEMRLEQMISLQSYGILAELGRMLGIQALKNADRYLGQFGQGDHPPRPSDDQLQRVEVAEDALEAVLRYLRQQAQPGGINKPQAAPPATAAEKQPAPLQSWTQPKLDAAIREYIAHRAGPLKSLTEAVQANRKGAVDAARKVFGRNVIAEALRVRSRAMVSKSEPWKEIADDLRLRPDGLRRLNNSNKTGFDIATEEKAASTGDPVADEVERRDAINFVRKKLKGERADAIVERLERGDISPDDAEEMVNMLLNDPDKIRPRHQRH